MALEVGAAAPDFRLRDQHGQTVELSSYRGRKAVVVVFYPWAFSRVCDGELRALRDALPRFQNDQVALVAISCDPMFSLRALSDTDNLGFPLLSDHWPHGAASKAFGVFNEITGVSNRSSFIVDRGGEIAWAVHHQIGHPRDLEQYAAALSPL